MSSKVTHNKHKVSGSSKPMISIVGGGCGCFRNSKTSGNGIVQRYIPPLLCERRKFDLRVFFLVARVNPIVAYVARVSRDFGYCKRCAVEYNKTIEGGEEGVDFQDPRSVAAHVTNQRAQREYLGPEHYKKMEADLLLGLGEVLR